MLKKQTNTRKNSMRYRVLTTNHFVNNSRKKERKKKTRRKEKEKEKKERGHRNP
jgi:hypothetical protein